MWVDLTNAIDVRHNFGALKACVPFVVDHYTAGVQASRVNYESVEFNRPVPDSLFAKPADVKAVKFTQ